MGLKFLSTPSARRATPAVGLVADMALFLSTPSARRATFPASAARPRRANFYPRPPRGGRRCCICMANSCCIFLSTPSARRATRRGSSPGAFLIFLSTPSARRATQYDKGERHNMENFYPRPPRGGRPKPVSMEPDDYQFLSTPSARRATYELEHPGQPQAISIHALREEGDA